MATKEDSGSIRSKMLERGIVPDTSALINGQVTSLIKRKELDGVEVYLPEAVFSELESLANRGLDTGSRGLKELRMLNEMRDEGLIEIHHVGRRPTVDEIKLAKSGSIDAIIRDVAFEEGAVLITADRVQAEVARSYGIEVEYTAKRVVGGHLKLERFFTEDTSSVHLKAGCIPLAKVGSIGDLQLVEIGDKPLTEKELEGMIRELYAIVNRETGAFMEIDYPEAKVFQINEMRIAVAKPPFSDALEITAVRPMVTVDINSYR
ncbi:MAG: PIN domain-containing protein, partial [Methermicoccaceae archaeon]